MPPLTNLENQCFDALLAVDRIASSNLLIRETAAWPPLKRIELLISPVLRRIGEEWEQGRISLAQVYMSGRICEDLVETLLPPHEPRLRTHPKMAIATLVDHHALGKRIVYSVLRSAGFELLDLGQGISVEALVTSVRKEGIRILLISTLMLRSALMVRDLKERLGKEGLDVRIVVGGAPFLFDRELWKDVGADAMVRTASDAIPVIEDLLKG